MRLICICLYFLHELLDQSDIFSDIYGINNAWDQVDVSELLQEADSDVENVQRNELRCLALDFIRGSNMNIVDYNRKAWNREVDRGNEWTIPVTNEAVEAARRGEWNIFLTPSKPVPKSWFPELKQTSVLCLASGGGQQGPILSAAGAEVTVFDNSSKQLLQDQKVAKENTLSIRIVQGSMTDLSVFENESFDLIVHPISNCFIPDIRPVWREAFRVLRHGGRLISGFVNPVVYIFDQSFMDMGILEVKHPLPYSDLTALTDEELQQHMDVGDPLEFGHTLELQISGQLDAGFVITGFYEDRVQHVTDDVLARYMDTYIATQAVKL